MFLLNVYSLEGLSAWQFPRTWNDVDITIKPKNEMQFLLKTF